MRHTRNVSLSEELHRFVDELIGTGRYQSASEVIRQGLRLLEERERHRPYHDSNGYRVGEGTDGGVAEEVVGQDPPSSYLDEFARTRE